MQMKHTPKILVLTRQPQYQQRWVRARRRDVLGVSLIRRHILCRAAPGIFQEIHRREPHWGLYLHGDVPAVHGQGGQWGGIIRHSHF